MKDVKRNQTELERNRGTRTTDIRSANERPGEKGNQSHTGKEEVETREMDEKKRREKREREEKEKKQSTKASL